METSQAPVANTRGLHSQALDLLRFPLAIIVVMSHIYPKFISGDMYLEESCQTVNYLFNGLVNFFYSFCRLQSVPIYFFISGYVFFLGIEFSKDTYVRKMKNRAKTLLIPYLIWNTFAIVSLLVTNLPALIKIPSLLNLHGLPSAYWIYNESLLSTVDNSWNTSLPIDVPLWFVRDLMIIVLCTPIINWLIEKFRFWPVLFFGCLWFGNIFIKPYDPFGLSSGFFTGFFFFSLGAYMSINKKNMVTEFGRFFKLSMILYPLLGVLCMLSAYICPASTLVIKQLTVLAGLLFAYNVAVWLLRGGYYKANPFLASASFFVYVSHYFIRDLVVSALYTIFRVNHPTDTAHVFLHKTLTFALTVTISLTAFWLLKRYTPSLLRVLTGRK